MLSRSSEQPSSSGGGSVAVVQEASHRPGKLLSLGATSSNVPSAKLKTMVILVFSGSEGAGKRAESADQALSFGIHRASILDQKEREE